MRTITIKKTVYNYSDLLLAENKELKNKVIQKEYAININHDWENLETYETAANLLGFYNFKIYYSGFHSQGDGACFESKYQYEKQSIKKVKKEFPKWIELHEIAKRLKDLQKVNFYQVLGGSKHSGFYYHENCMQIDLERNDYKEITNESYFISVFKDFAKLIYKSLNSDYDYLTSEEAILETIEANGYEFDQYGNII